MNVSAVVELYRQELLSLYPAVEVESFIAIAFEEVLAYSKVDIFMNKEHAIPDQLVERLFSILEGLKVQKPIQYIIGKTVFYGLPIEVNNHVLIPRQETEELVHWILKSDLDPNCTILDLGTGSGCIALALKDNMKNAVVRGADNSVSALNTANKNAQNNNLNIDFFQFDILEQESLGFMEFDLIVSNPPYVQEAERDIMERNVLDYEPESAIFVGQDDPLIFYRKIVDLADGHLTKRGRLFFEINAAFGKEIVQLLKDRGFVNVSLRKDYNGKDRMVSAMKS